jgi:hypothetical protein
MTCLVDGVDLCRPRSAWVGGAENLGIRCIHLPIKSLYYNDPYYKLCVLMESSRSGEQIDTKISILEVLVVWWS